MRSPDYAAIERGDPRARLAFDRRIQDAAAAREQVKVTAARLGCSVDTVVRTRMRLGVGKWINPETRVKTGRKLGSTDSWNATVNDAPGCQRCGLRGDHVCLHGIATKGLGGMEW